MPQVVSRLSPRLPPCTPSPWRSRTTKQVTHILSTSCRPAAPMVHGGFMVGSVDPPKGLLLCMMRIQTCEKKMFLHNCLYYLLFHALCKMPQTSAEPLGNKAFWTGIFCTHDINWISKRDHKTTTHQPFKILTFNTSNSLIRALFLQTRHINHVPTAHHRITSRIICSSSWLVQDDAKVPRFELWPWSLGARTWGGSREGFGDYVKSTSCQTHIITSHHVVMFNPRWSTSNNCQSMISQAPRKDNADFDHKYKLRHTSANYPAKSTQQILNDQREA